MKLLIEEYGSGLVIGIIWTSIIHIFIRLFVMASGGLI